MRSSRAKIVYAAAITAPRLIACDWHGIDDAPLLDDLSTFVIHQILACRAAKVVLTFRDQTRSAGNPRAVAGRTIRPPRPRAVVARRHRRSGRRRVERSHQCRSGRTPLASDPRQHAQTCATSSNTSPRAIGSCSAKLGGNGVRTSSYHPAPSRWSPPGSGNCRDRSRTSSTSLPSANLSSCVP